MTIDTSRTGLDSRTVMDYTKVSNMLEAVAAVDSDLKAVGNNQGAVCRLDKIVMAAETSSLDS